MDVNYILNGAKKKQDALSPSYILNGTTRQVTKKTKMTNVSNRDFWKMNAVGSSKSWMDSDKDGVINGIDCYPYDVNRHGFFARAFNYFK